MDILYSQKMRSIADAYNLQPDELAFADLVSAGWDKTDAFFTAFHTGETWTKQALADTIRKLSAREGVKRRIKEIRNPKTKVTADVSDDSDNLLNEISKEAMLKDLAKARKKMTFGSKEWLDTNKMIADITRMKQEEVKTEDNTVHYFIPLTCHKCSLYINNRKK